MFFLEIFNKFIDVWRVLEGNIYVQSSSFVVQNSILLWRHIRHCVMTCTKRMQMPERKWPVKNQPTFKLHLDRISLIWSLDSSLLRLPYCLSSVPRLVTHSAAGPSTTSPTPAPKYSGLQMTELAGLSMS